VEVTLGMMGNRWKILILRELFRDGVRRFTHLERDGIVNRKAYPEIPPKVEYSLTPVGESLKPVIASLHDWGSGYLNGRGGLEEGGS
jgi:DNA-binding HxlR family transcriptional regulator